MDSIEQRNLKYDKAAQIPTERKILRGDLTVPESALGIVLFAHGTGSSRHSPRNRAVASVLQQAGLATLLMDLLTADEETVDLRTAELRFDIDLLARRLVGAARWRTEEPANATLPIRCLGPSPGGGPAQ